MIYYIDFYGVWLPEWWQEGHDPLIGQGVSRDLISGLWLVDTISKLRDDSSVVTRLYDER